jgi:hypothetical protein
MVGIENLAVLITARSTDLPALANTHVLGTWRGWRVGDSYTGQFGSAPILACDDGVAVVNGK